MRVGCWVVQGIELFIGLSEHEVVLENSNVAQLASALYLLVHSLPQEDR